MPYQMYDFFSLVEHKKHKQSIHYKSNDERLY